MEEVVHRIEAPVVASAVVRRMPDAVEKRVAHLHVAGRHVPLGAQNVRPVGELPGAHPREEVQVLLYGSLAAGAFPTGFRDGPAMLPDFLLGLAVHVWLSVPGAAGRGV